MGFKGQHVRSKKLKFLLLCLTCSLRLMIQLSFSVFIQNCTGVSKSTVHW